VLHHVEWLAGRSPERIVPTPALTTGPRLQARNWWWRFRAAVHRDAVDRGLARRRWSGARRALLVLAAVVPSLVLGFAAALSLAEDDVTDAGVLGSSAVYAVVVLLVAGAVVVTRSGVTDTSAGRAAAARWLGLRAVLARDGRLAGSQPSDVDVWSRTLAYATAMGLAPGAAQGLPLGPSSHRRVWSPVGGTWRPVQIRYPRGWGGIPPWGALVTGLALLVPPLGGALFIVQRGDWDTESVGWLLPALAPWLLLGALGAVAVVQGVLDIVTPRRTVQGQVLQLRRKRSSKSLTWFAVVDDGTSDRIRAWWLPQEPAFGVGAVVRAEVSRYVGHARGVEVVEPSDPAAPGPADLASSFERMVASQARARRGGDPPREPLLHLGVTPAAPPTPQAQLPDAAMVGELIGRPVHVDGGGQPPAGALPGRFVMYRADMDVVGVAWIDEQGFEKFRRGPRLLRPRVDGLGDEAYRVRVGRTLAVRRGRAAIMVAPFVRGKSKQERDQIAAALARHCFALTNR
jgi:hypothetical protein